jgi:hypothetical protein
MAGIIRRSTHARSAPRWLADERGIETLEWVLIGGLITAVAVVVFPGTLLPQLLVAANAIAALLGGS